MIIDRSQRGWIFFTLAAVLAITAVYLWAVFAYPGGLSGGSRLGLSFGIAGSALMVYAGALSIRKRLARYPYFGTARQWLAGHVWLGLLSGPLILYHANFRWGGLVEQLTLATFVVVYLSGIIGLVLQQFLPRLTSALVPAQAIFEQIPAACQALQAKADALVAKQCGPLTPDDETTTFRPERVVVQFYLQELRPRLCWPAGKTKVTDGQLRLRLQEIREIMPVELHGLLDGLTSIFEERRQLDWQWYIHGWLHGWLLVHVPMSVLLLVLATAHAVISVWY